MKNVLFRIDKRTKNNFSGCFVILPFIRKNLCEIGRSSSKDVYRRKDKKNLARCIEMNSNVNINIVILF